MSTLYYSKGNINCLEFLKKLKQENMLKVFDEYFCIDGRDPKTFPKWLHSIPTIIVPESDKPLIGEDAFAWLTFKLNQKYKQAELGTINQNQGNFVNLNTDPADINLDSADYISIHNIDKPIKPSDQDVAKYRRAETMDVAQRLEQYQQERSNFSSHQKGSQPQAPNFSFK